MSEKRRQIAISDDPYLPLPELSTYSGLGISTLRAWLVHPTHPLPCLRVGKIITVRRSEYDAWVEHFRVGASPATTEETSDEMDAKVARAVKSIRGVM
jgi:hypothetical protein